MILAMLLTLAVPDTGDGICSAGPAAALEGRHYHRHIPTRAKALSGARIARVVMPGEMVTQDFREDRVTIRVDHRRTITSVRCG